MRKSNEAMIGTEIIDEDMSMPLYAEETEEEIAAEEDAAEEFEQEEKKRKGIQLSVEEWEQIVKDYNGTDPRLKDIAGEKAYNAMAPFVTFLGKKFYCSYFQKYHDDLISEGCLGLVEGLKTYNPRKTKPTTWFSRSIIHYMREFIDREIHHTTTHYQGNTKKIRAYINEKEARGENWDYDDIVVHTGISLTTVINCLMIEKRNKDTVSIDQTIGDNNGALGDMLYSNIPDPEDELIKTQTKEQIYKDMQQCLTEDEMKVLILRYGFYDGIPKSAVQIEKIIGISKQDVRQTINRAEYKMRRFANLSQNYELERKSRSIYGQVKGMETFKQSGVLSAEIDSYEFDSDFDAADPFESMENI